MSGWRAVVELALELVRFFGELPRALGERVVGRREAVAGRQRLLRDLRVQRVQPAEAVEDPGVLLGGRRLSLEIQTDGDADGAGSGQGAAEALLEVAHFAPARFAGGESSLLAPGQRLQKLHEQGDLLVCELLAELILHHHLDGFGQCLGGAIVEIRSRELDVAQARARGTRDGPLRDRSR